MLGGPESQARFGPYRIDGVIGRGGMGEVHRAVDVRKQRAVALKRLPVTLGEDNSFQARFRREAETAARLSEPHVIPIHDFGEIDGQLYIDMRLVDGTDLATVLARQGPLPVARAVDVCRQVAEALDAAHRAGLVHRDIKPSNILITAHDFVYLIDFGIASSVQSTRLTSTGATIGTALYMAPERFVGHDDHRVDIYALCCVLFEAITGTPPFPGRDFPSLMYAHVNSPVPSLGDRRPGVPSWIEAVVTTGLDKNPDRRQQSAGELAADLRVPEATPPSGTRVDFAAQPTATGASRGWITAALGCGVLALAAVVLVLLAAFVWPDFTGPGKPDDVASQAASALASKDPAAVDRVSCKRSDGKPVAAALPPQALQLIQSVVPSGPAVQTLDSEARQPINLTLGVGGQTQTAPAEIVFAVDRGTWCMNNIEAGAQQ